MDDFIYSYVTGRGSRDVQSMLICAIDAGTIIDPINAGNLVYSSVAKALREDSYEDAEFMYEDKNLVWC